MKLIIISIMQMNQNSFKPLVNPQGSVDDRNLSTVDLKHDDVAHADGIFLDVGEEQNVPPVKGRLHAAAVVNSECGHLMSVI